MKKTVTVLVTARNEERTLPKTLRSLANQTLRAEKIIVVDDGSDDRTKFISELWGATKVIRLPNSSGKKSRAQNAALDDINTDLVITVDADTELAPDAIEKLVAPFEEADPPHGACGMVLPRRVRGIWQRGRLIEYLFGQVYYKPLQGAYNCILVAPGCISAWDMKVIRARGGFEAPEVKNSDRIDLIEDMGLTMWAVTEGKKFGRGGMKVKFVHNAFAYTADPPTFKIYRGQIKRWYSGFFQNLKLNKWRLLKFQNPLLSVFVGAAIFDAVVGSFFFFWKPLLQWWGLEYTLLYRGVLTALLIELGLIVSFCLYGGWKTKRLATTVASLPFFPITFVVNRLYFLQAFVREMVLRRPLSRWDKGH